MASLIPESGALLNYANTAPAPSKDYCQIYVTLDKVIFRWWKISLRSSTKIAPGEIKDEHEDFLYDERAQSEITQVFGKKMLEYVKGLASGHIDYLPRLPNELLIRIIMELELEDIGRLAQVSKQFRKLCRGDQLWERIYTVQSETPVTEDLRSLAEAIGWRKLFFTNKLRLQLHLHRRNISTIRPADN